VRKLRGAWVVLVGAEDTRARFEQMLTQEVRSRLIGGTTVEAHADEMQLLAAVRPVLYAWHAEREAAILERWRQETSRNGRATAGWEETLEAASEGRIDLLLAQEGAARPAYECPRCGRAHVTDGGCPTDGTAMESRADGLDLAVHKTLVNGGTVHVLRACRDLDPVDGVAALLRC